MGKQPPFSLVVVESARAELGGLRAFDRTAVVDAIDAHLIFEPLRPSRRRKLLGRLEAGFEYDSPLWELKAGQVRVFYTVDEQSRIVCIHAVRKKPPEMTTSEVLR